MARGRRDQGMIEGFKDMVISSFVELFGKKDADDEDNTTDGKKAKKSKKERRLAFFKMLRAKKKGK